jgi:hypothetical protein
MLQVLGYAVVCIGSVPAARAMLRLAGAPPVTAS